MSFQKNYTQIITTDGELTLNGECEFKCSCQPSIPSALCLASSGFHHELQAMRAKWESPAFITAGSLAIGGIGFFVIGEAAIGLGSLPVAMGAAEAYANQSLPINPISFKSKDKKIRILFNAIAIRELSR